MPQKRNNSKAARGANAKRGNVSVKLRPEEERELLARQLGIKPRTKEFVDTLLDNKGMSQKDAYMITHPKASSVTARNAASKLLQKPAVIGYKASAVGKAKRRIISLVESGNESIALKASQDIIDRNEGKAVQKNETTSQVVEVKLDLSGVRVGAHYVSAEQRTAIE